MELEELKQKIYEFLLTNPTKAYSMQELTDAGSEPRWKVQKAVSQLDDEGKVRLRVLKKIVYAHVR